MDGISRHITDYVLNKFEELVKENSCTLVLLDRGESYDIGGEPVKEFEVLFQSKNIGRFVEEYLEHLTNYMLNQVYFVPGSIITCRKNIIINPIVSCIGNDVTYGFSMSAFCSITPQV